MQVENGLSYIIIIAYEHIQTKRSKKISDCYSLERMSRSTCTIFAMTPFDDKIKKSTKVSQHILLRQLLQFQKYSHFLIINLQKVMKVIENNFYIQLYKIINNGERYFLNFLFSLRYFAHECNRQKNTHTHTHARSHTLTYTHMHIQKQGVMLHINLWYFVRGRS